MMKKEEGRLVRVERVPMRWGEMDALGHMNNVSYFRYFEQARIQYVRHLGLFIEGQSFMDIGVIVADIHIVYRQPINWDTPVKVGVRTARLGTVSQLRLLLRSLSRLWLAKTPSTSQRVDS